MCFRPQAEGGSAKPVFACRHKSEPAWHFYKGVELCENGRLVTLAHEARAFPPIRPPPSRLQSSTELFGPKQALFHIKHQTTFTSGSSLQCQRFVEVKEYSVFLSTHVIMP